MPQQKYIKFLYEKEDCSISQISDRVGVNWRTAAKYAKKDDWNKPLTKPKRRRPIMDPYAETIDTWLMEDMLKPRKDRLTAAAIYQKLKEEYSFIGSARTVRQYVSDRKKELRFEQEEQYLKLEHIPGHAQVDFGTARVIWNGELREIKYLALSFPYSNAGFCVPVPSENEQCFLYALIQVFGWIGGVPQKMRFDNLPEAVAYIAKDGKRVLTEAFTRFMLHYRFEAEFCSQGKGNEKGNIENKVGYTRRNWLLPYPEVMSFAELTEKLYQRALKDLNRLHYARGVPMTRLFAEDQKALLPLPSVAFEPVELQAARADKYSRIKVKGEVYDVINARPKETVLVKLWWDRVEVLDKNQNHLAIFPRQYTLKQRPIDWKGYFSVFVKKPRGARHATMYKFLPEVIRNYLDHDDFCLYKERLKLIHALLQEGFLLDQIAKALEDMPKHHWQDSSLIRHYLNRAVCTGRPLEALSESYTPASVKDYTPLIDAYNRLMPGTAGKGGEDGCRSFSNSSVRP